MFNRLFCFLFLATIGLNLTLSNLNLKAQEVDLQKPYISEVWHGNSDYTDKCIDRQIQSESAVDYCPMDTWIEITNPTNSSIDLSEYKIDVTANRSFVEKGKCEDLDLENKKDKKTNNLYCESVNIQNKTNLNETILPNSQILFQQKYGRIINMLTRVGLSATKLDLVRRGSSAEFYSISLINNDNVIDEFNSNFDSKSSVEVCFDINGEKTQNKSSKPFQAEEKLFYGTPGQPNDCPQIQTQIPIVATPIVEEPKVDQSPIQTKPLEEKITLPIEQKAVITEQVVELIQENISEKKNEILEVSNQIQPNQNQAILIKSNETKLESVPEVGQTEPINMIRQEQTEQLQPKTESAVKQEIGFTNKIEPEISQPNQPINSMVEDKVFAELAFKQTQVAQTPIVTEQTFKSEPSLDSQIKVVSIKDEEKSESLGKNVSKLVTMDMYNVKLNFVFFNLAFVLYLISKTISKNRFNTCELWNFLCSKIFGQVK